VRHDLGAEIFHALKANSKRAFKRAEMYMGHPLACAAALAVQRVIRRDNLLENVRRRAPICRAG
jgi:adenosylmethionine-8-amino-7-oxononanoate aminotransferase